MSLCLTTRQSPAEEVEAVTVPATREDPSKERELSLPFHLSCPLHVAPLQSTPPGGMYRAVYRSSLSAGKKRKFELFAHSATAKNDNNSNISSNNNNKKNKNIIINNINNTTYYCLYKHFIVTETNMRTESKIKISKLIPTQVFNVVKVPLQCPNC